MNRFNRMLAIGSLFAASTAGQNGNAISVSGDAYVGSYHYRGLNYAYGWPSTQFTGFVTKGNTSVGAFLNVDPVQGLNEADAIVEQGFSLGKNQLAVGYNHLRLWTLPEKKTQEAYVKFGREIGKNELSAQVTKDFDNFSGLYAQGDLKRNLPIKGQDVTLGLTGRINHGYFLDGVRAEVGGSIVLPLEVGDFIISPEVNLLYRGSKVDHTGGKGWLIGFGVRITGK